ncbi:hypothetical protein D9M68_910750 [compost metagenome]
MVVSNTTASANTNVTSRSWMRCERSSQGPATPSSAPTATDVPSTWMLPNAAITRSPEVLRCQ